MPYEVLLINAERYYFDNHALSRLHKAAGLGILSACANAQNYKCKIFQGDPNKVVQILKREITLKNIKLVGFYCQYFNQTEVISLSKFIKDTYNLPVIVGGPQSVVLGEEFFLKSGADVVVQGEGEESFIELLDYFLDRKKDLSLADIAGITFMSPEGNLVKTTDRPLIENLDAIPFANAGDYLPESNNTPKGIGILTGRGCPFSCAFCYEGHNTKRVRYRSVENVLSEIEKKLASSKLLHNYICFYDDTFTLDAERLAKMCAGLSKLREKYDFTWYCEGHISFLVRHPQTIPMMLSAGLVRLQLGVESGCQEVLDVYNKKITLSQIEEVIRLCAEYKVPQVIFNIIVGGAWETEETFKTSLDFALKLLKIEPGMVEINPSMYMPLPNTPMTLEPEKFGLKITDPESYTSQNDYPVVQTQTLSRENIYEMNSRFHRTNLNTMKAFKEKISFERILNIFKLHQKYGVFPKWYVALQAEEHWRIYFQRLLEDYSLLKDATPEKKMSLRPMRTVPLLDYDGIGYQIHHYKLSPLESHILLYSVGKLTVQEQAGILYPTLGGQDTFEKFLEKIIDCHHTFERRFWMNFSEY